MIILLRWIEVNIVLNKIIVNVDGEGLRYNLKLFLDVYIIVYFFLVDILKICIKCVILILIMNVIFL